MIAGAEFEADLNTVQRGHKVLLAEGAYVEVLYVIEKNGAIIVRIEAHVPPGAGDHDDVGKVEAIHQGSATVAAASPMTIVVDGVSYTINPATQVLDDGGLAVGSTVSINSYTTENGENVATRVISVTLDKTLSLPFAQR